MFIRTTTMNFYPIAQYFDDDTGSSYCWDFNVIYDDNGESSVQPGILWEGQGTPLVQQCPSFLDGSADWDDNPYTGYNYNTSYIGHGEGEDIETPAKTTAVQHPFKTVIFGDGQYVAGADKFMRAPFPNPGDASFPWTLCRHAGVPPPQSYSTPLSGTAMLESLGKIAIQIIRKAPPSRPALASFLPIIPCTTQTDRHLCMQKFILEKNDIQRKNDALFETRKFFSAKHRSPMSGNSVKIGDGCEAL